MFSALIVQTMQLTIVCIFALSFLTSTQQYAAKKNILVCAFMFTSLHARNFVFQIFYKFGVAFIMFWSVTAFWYTLLLHFNLNYSAIKKIRII